MMAPPQQPSDLTYTWPSLRLRFPRPPRLRIRWRPSGDLGADIAFLAGLCAVAAGCGWIFPPTAPIVGGLFLAAIGWRTARSGEREPELREPTQVVEQYVFGDVEED